MKRPPLRFPMWRDLAEMNAVSNYIDSLEAIAEIAGRFHAAYNTDDGVEFHGAEELTLLELNDALGDALAALAKRKAQGA